MGIITPVLQSPMKCNGLYVCEAAGYSRECNIKTELKEKNQIFTGWIDNISVGLCQIKK